MTVTYFASICHVNSYYLLTLRGTCWYNNNLSACNLLFLLCQSSHCVVSIFLMSRGWTSKVVRVPFKIFTIVKTKSSLRNVFAALTEISGSPTHAYQVMFCLPRVQRPSLGTPRISPFFLPLSTLLLLFLSPQCPMTKELDRPFSLIWPCNSLHLPLGILENDSGVSYLTVIKYPAVPGSKLHWTVIRYQVFLYHTSLLYRLKLVYKTRM